MRCLVYQLIFCSLAFSADPAWIWKEKGSASQMVYFRREFTLPEVPKRAEFRGVAVDSMYIHVNAERVGEGTGGGLVEFPVRNLRKGRNVMALRCTKPKGQGGLALVLEVELADGRIFSISSDDRFRCRNTNPSAPWKTLAYTSTNWKRAKEIPATAYKANPVKLKALAGSLDSVELGVSLGKQFRMKLLGAGGQRSGPFTLVQGLEFSLYGTDFIIDEVDTVDGERIFWLKSKRTDRRYGPFRYENGVRVSAGGLSFMLRP
jgi:hypothetical protein